MAATYRLTFDADGHPTRIKDDFAATGAPTVDDDFASGGWTTGSLWYVPTTDTLYLCESAASGAADWVLVTGGGPGGGAPTDVDYLVGTASAELSNEIVVGTAPGGELGGAWAAPTVGTTHAGSSHADAQAAAEATAAAGLAAHTGDDDAHHAWPLTEGDIPASIARDTEVASAVAAHAGDDDTHHARYTDAEADARAAAAVTTHEAGADPHPGYLTAAAGDAAYEPLGEVATHAADPDAHHTWPLTDGDIPASIARDAEVGAAITAHAEDADAHHTRYTDAEAVAAVGPHYAPDWGEVADIAAEPFGATAAAGVLEEEARADHRHAMPADPVPAHAADADAHHTWPLSEPDIPAAIARDSEVTAAIGAHAGTADAHHARYTDAEADARAAAAVATHAGLTDPHAGYVQEAATPGGELGGTYAVPTVDAVHAGSSHAATQAAAEATAAAALASHAGDADAHHAEDHAARHASGGADPLKLDDLGTPDDTTDLDASTGAHGLLPKLTGSTAEFLRGDGSWGAGAGGVTDHGALTGLADDDHSQYLRADGSRGLSGPWTPGDGIDMAGGSFRVPGAEILSANLDARTLTAEVDGSGSLVNLYVGVDTSVPRKRVLLTGDTPTAPVRHVYTSNGTWTKPTDAAFSHIEVEVQGGGGGGGGVAGTSANEASISGGGGGGGYARKLLSAADLAGLSSATVTVGGGGSGGNAGNNDGNGGNASSFAGSGITTVQGNGGSGGEGDGGGTGNQVHDGGAGGGASGGDATITGGDGGNNNRFSFPATSGCRPLFGGGFGGGSHLAGSQRMVNIGSAGADGQAHGGGGTGCSLDSSTTGKAGGDGAAGVVIVTEYYMGVAG